MADIATFEIAAALLKVTSTPMTDLRQYINSILVYNDRQSLFTVKIPQNLAEILTQWR